jgi:hypothetical protein
MSEITPTSGAAPSTEPDKQLDREWLLVSAVREGVSIGKRQQITYRDAFDYSVQLAPRLIGPDSILAERLEPDLPTYYRTKAESLTRSHNRPVSALDLAIADLEEIDALIASARQQQRPALERRQGLLRQAIIVLDTSRWTETQAIRRDQLNPPRLGARGVRLPISNAGQDYLEFDVRETGRSIRARVLHPDPAEWKTGVDLIYESYWVDNTGAGKSNLLVRIAALQYKMWDGKTISLGKDGRALAQLQRAHNAFCAAGFCTSRTDETSYRLPNCSVFLRPTDRMQTRRGWAATRGRHIPLCRATKCIVTSAAGNQVISGSSIRNCSVNQSTFESLFSHEMLGSEWIPATELQDAYTRAGIFADLSRPVLHLQEFSRSHLTGLG